VQESLAVSCGVPSSSIPRLHIPNQRTITGRWYSSRVRRVLSRPFDVRQRCRVQTSVVGACPLGTRVSKKSLAASCGVPSSSIPRLHIPNQRTITGRPYSLRLRRSHTRPIANSNRLRVVYYTPAFRRKHLSGTLYLTYRSWTAFIPVSRLPFRRLCLHQGASARSTREWERNLCSRRSKGT
jgi:hypothetical protein